MVSASVCATAGELLGVLLASYGLIRESFADLAEKRTYGEGRYGQGTFAGTPSRLTRAILSIATGVRLIPRDHTLTLTDRKRNAALAIVGTIIAASSLVWELVLNLG